MHFGQETCETGSGQCLYSLQKRRPLLAHDLVWSGSHSLSYVIQLDLMFALEKILSRDIFGLVK